MPTLLTTAMLLLATICHAQAGDALQLTLPKECYAVIGAETSIYFDNIVLTRSPEKYRFSVACDIGVSDSRRWTATPGMDAVGEHDLSITVRELNSDKRLARATTTLRVVSADSGSGRHIRLLIVGDSLTHATLYPNEMARLLSRPSNPTWEMLGTHKPKPAAQGVAHEGYGGWTWGRFVTKYEPNPDGTHRKRSSPFVYLDNQGKPQLNVERYLTEKCGGAHPDFVIFMLGINDCFSAPPNAPNARIELALSQADILLKAFRVAAPNAQLGICLTTPPNSREAAFQANYKGRYSRWNWKRIQHQLVQSQLDHFANDCKAKTFVVPTHLSLDTIDGYPENNGVHPNAFGYKQIGVSVYSWLKWRLADSGHE